MSQLLQDFQSYIRRNTYRPVSSGDEQRQKAEDLALLGRVKEKLEAAEAFAAGTVSAEDHASLLRQYKLLQESFEKANGRIRSLTRTAATVLDLRASNQHLTIELDKLTKTVTVNIPSLAQLNAAVALTTQERRSRILPALVAKAADLCLEGQEEIQECHLTMATGIGNPVNRQQGYRLAKVIFFLALKAVTGIPLSRLVQDANLGDQMDADLFIKRHHAIQDGEGFEARLKKVVDQLEAYALEQEVVEAVR